ncbi:hypothetical protein FRC10_000410 [Ceratobasidium sp. 414]|nr:hypothetical protein FRC10_000410 [Ceratobasidium sp. 414]
MENNNILPDLASSESAQSNVYSDAFQSWQEARKIFDTAVKDYVAACAIFNAVCAENPAGSRVNDPQRDQALAALEPELPQIASNLGQVTNAAKMMKVLRNRSATLAPISRLSSELLVRIFESLDYSGPLGPALEKGTWPFPESVACVSTYWRELALNNGQLWTRISFDLPSHLGDKLYKWAEARLRNSQGHRIELCVHETIFTEDGFQKLLDFLPRVVPRLAAIKFRSLVLKGDSAPRILSCWFTHDTHDAITDLQLIGSRYDSRPQDLRLRLTQSHPIEIIEDRFSRVQYLTLHNTFVNWSSRLYHGLVELDLEFKDGRSLTLSVGHIAGMLSASPMLRVLKLRGLHVLDSSPMPEPVRLDHLEILFLHCSGLYLLPVLQPGSKPIYVRLTFTTFNPDPCLQLLKRSRVVKLIIESDVETALPPALFTILPVTQHLVLVNFELSVEFFLSMNYPLALRDNSQCPTVWPLLRTLHFVDCRFANDFVVQSIRLKTPIPYHFAMWTSRCNFDIITKTGRMSSIRAKDPSREQPILEALQAYIPGAQGASNEPTQDAKSLTFIQPMGTRLVSVHLLSVAARGPRPPA